MIGNKVYAISNHFDNLIEVGKPYEIVRYFPDRKETYIGISQIDSFSKVERILFISRIEFQNFFRIVP